ncbi:unnamed protein product [Soboliphyme baturini]|uniref:Transmembrane 9 superfamily member n=1 Tax=Soboliphyme baturini TaxID=241478 RepID=A0A183ISA6_9BILA|nr:unnamed protein product [Soboliphyme baturini]
MKNLTNLERMRLNSKLKVTTVLAVKLTSTKNILPYEYYSLPFCKPKGKILYKPENLGEIIRGDRIVSTPYKVKQLASVLLFLLFGENTIVLFRNQSQLLIDRIREDYRVHLLADSLPCATRVENADANALRYSFGYKLGFIEDDKVSTVASCIPLFLDSNKIIWSYSVEWKLSDVQWSNRWDHYLKMTNSGIHWFNIINSFGLVLFFLCFIGLVIIRIVRRDIANYNKLDESDEVLEETGWKLIHGDVFRPPYWPKLFVSMVGTGIQIFGMSLIIIVFAMFGMLSPSSRGLMMTTSLFLYCFMGLFSGYFSGRLFKTFRGVHWKKTAFQTALLFPGFLFTVGLFLNGFVWHESSSGALPFTTFVALLSMLLGIDVPLVFIGFRFGYRKQMFPRQSCNLFYFRRLRPLSLF